MPSPPTRPNIYKAILVKIFVDRYRHGVSEIPFVRQDLIDAATALGVPLPRNLGDIVYSNRYRTGLDGQITKTQPPGKAWVIEGTGRSSYAFRLLREVSIAPNPALRPIKIPDATPEIIGRYALSDEQALLARVRYNRLIDIFLGIAAYSLQNHLRTSVDSIGQIEIDEVYVGVDCRGAQYVIPVQAKGGTDRLSMVQTRQDFACCGEKFPDLLCRSISAQFAAEGLIALFEVGLEKDGISILDERHYRLVPADEISASELKDYSARGAKSR